MSKELKVGHKSARKKRRQSMKIFNRHRILNRANDTLYARNGWTPEWKKVFEAL